MLSSLFFNIRVNNYRTQEEMKISEKLKSHAFQTFLACALLFHVKILETESGSDYSDLELRLMLGTYEKFIMRDLRTRFVYLQRKYFKTREYKSIRF